MTDEESESVRDAWIGFLCSQTDHLLPQFAVCPLDLAKARGVLEEHLAAVRVAENLLYQRFNTMLPVHRLPDELLAHIMVYTCAADESSCYLPVKLMTVCQRWYTVVTSFPEVWGSPPPRFTERGIQSILSRSKSTPLHISWNMPGLSVTDTLNRAPFGLLMPRCQSLALAATPTILQVILPSFGREEAPCLRELSVTANEESDDEDAEMTASRWPANLFKGSTPRLRELTLNDFACFDWSHALLRAPLTSLVVDFVDSDYLCAKDLDLDSPHRAGCSLQSLVDAIECLPSLEKLDLRHCLSTSLLFGASAARPRVKLQNLRNLAVEDNPRSCNLFNECISLNFTQTSVAYKFGLSDDHNSEDMATFLRSIPLESFSYLDVVVHQFSSKDVRSILFYFNNNDSEKLGYHLSLQADIHAAPDETSEYYRKLLVTMAASLRLQHIFSLRVAIGQRAGKITVPMWLNAFAHASRVSQLHVGSSEVPSLSHALCYRQSSTPKASPRLFQRLAAVYPAGTTRRDMFFLERAVEIRAPGRSLGYFYVVPNIHQVSIATWRPRVYCVDQDGKRTVWRPPNPLKRHILPGRHSHEFNVSTAIEAMRIKKRAKRKGKQPHISATEHEEALRDVYEDIYLYA
ncbi:unnamed protein product [Peniophora sp. CBMAI 1063]|nr:unnamed protein product [Peniophora sp. CBMAI 1063]